MEYLYERETVTPANIDAMRAVLSTDQAHELVPGQTVTIIKAPTPAPEGSTITIWHDAGRAAIYTGGDSDWGDVITVSGVEAIQLDTADSDGGPIIIGLDGEVSDAAVERAIAAEREG